MLKIRLKRLGAKKNPTYRIIVINSTTKREGKPIQELGHYNPKTKVMQLDKASAESWIKKGAAAVLRTTVPQGTRQTRLPFEGRQERREQTTSVAARTRGILRSTSFRSE